MEAVAMTSLPRLQMKSSLVMRQAALQQPLVERPLWKLRCGRCSTAGSVAL